MPSVICYWTDAWHYEIYLFYIIWKSYDKTQKLAFAYFGEHEKKPFDAVSLAAMHTKELWLV